MAIYYVTGLEKDVTKTVSLTLEEAHRGKHIDLVYDRTVSSNYTTISISSRSLDSF